jgi:hypothetical protein
LPRYLGTGDRRRGNLVEDDRSSFGIGQAIIKLFGFDAPVEWRHDDSGQLTCPMHAGHGEPVL